MVSRVSVFTALLFSIWLLPDAASAGTKVCDFHGPDVLYEDREGYGHFAYYPAYEYYCRGESFVYADHLRFSDMKAFAGARFHDEKSAWRWLFRNEATLAPLRSSLSLQPVERAKRAGTVLGRMLDAEIIGISALQIGAVSITLLPQFRVLKGLRWMLEAPDTRRVARSFGYASDLATHRNDRQ